MRDRIMEAVHPLAEGDEGVWRVWPDEYFEELYDVIPHRESGAFPTNSALTEEERTLLIKLRTLLDAACDATPKTMTVDELIATGWPKRVQPTARNVLDLMVRRGRFSEDVEEQVPSCQGHWP